MYQFQALHRAVEGKTIVITHHSPNRFTMSELLQALVEPCVRGALHDNPDMQMKNVCMTPNPLGYGRHA